MTLEARKLRLIQFIVQLEDQGVYDGIEAIIYTSSDDFGIESSSYDNEDDYAQNQAYTSDDEADELMGRFKTLMGNADDPETRERILHQEFTSDERLKLVLLFRLEEMEKHPENLIDYETFIANLKTRRQKRKIENILLDIKTVKHSLSKTHLQNLTNKLAYFSQQIYLQLQDFDSKIDLEVLDKIAVGSKEINMLENIQKLPNYNEWIETYGDFQESLYDANLTRHVIPKNTDIHNLMNKIDTL